MTSDTKIGLLLGLVFIIVIALLMNGLPEILSRNTSDRVTTTTGNQNRALRLDANADDAVRRVQMMDLPFPTRRINIDQTDRRFAQHSNTNADTRISRHFEPAGSKRKNSNIRVYTVKDGDNLAKIAKHIYGDQIGNERATIQKIFHANKDVMNSPDHIAVGQKIRIPNLQAKTNTTALQSIESTGMFNKLKGTFSNMVNPPSPKNCQRYMS